MKLVILPALLVLCSSLSSAPSLPEKHQKWLNQDVVYIISAQERAEFLGLSTDEQRETFIGRFWKIRDTDSSTEENEFKMEHYKRIQYANERFIDGSPGWKSERGRVWIMHGPPDDIHYDYGGGSLAIDIQNPTPVLLEEANADRQRFYRLTLNKPETETWVYRHIDGAKSATSYFEIIFSRTDPTQIYMLNQSLRFAAGGTLTYGERVQRDNAIMRFLKGHFFGGPYRIIYAGEYKFQDLEDFYQSLFHPQRLPKVEVVDYQMGVQDVERSTGEVLMEKLALGRRLKEKVRSRIFFEELPLSVRVGTLQAASGATLVPISLGFDVLDGQGHLLMQKNDTLDLLLELATEKGDPAASIADSMDLKRKESSSAPAARFLYQTRLVARPGQYRLSVYAALRLHPAAAVRTLDVVLPNYAAGDLQMSDLLLFDSILPKDAYRTSRASGSRTARFLGHTNPVFLKDFVLIPSCDSRFRRGQKLTAFFEVYNPGIPSGAKTPALQVKCLFKKDGELLQELPERLLNYMTDSDARRTTYGVSIPLLGFATGQYSVEFNVRDPVGGGDVRRAATFTVY